MRVGKFMGLISTFVEVCKNYYCHPPHPTPVLILKRVKVKRAQEARDNQFLFQNVQNNEIFKIFEWSNTIVILTFTTQKANACSLLDWLFCPVVPFLGKFSAKTKIISLS